MTYKIGAAGSSETLVTTLKTVRHHNPEGYAEDTKPFVIAVWGAKCPRTVFTGSAVAISSVETSACQLRDLVSETLTCKLSPSVWLPFSFREMLFFILWTYAGMISQPPNKCTRTHTHTNLNAEWQYSAGSGVYYPASYSRVYWSPLINLKQCCIKSGYSMLSRDIILCGMYRINIEKPVIQTPLNLVSHILFVGSFRL